MPSQGLTSDLGSVVAKFLLTPFNQTLAALPHEYIQLCCRHMLLQTQETWVSLYNFTQAFTKELLQTKLNVSLSSVSKSQGLTPL